MGELERMESAEAELAEWHKASDRIHAAIDSVPDAPDRVGHIADRAEKVCVNLKALHRANAALTERVTAADAAVLGLAEERSRLLGERDEARRESDRRLGLIERIAETLADAGWGDADDRGQDLLDSLQALVASCERLADDACAANLGTPTIADHIKACVDAGYDVRRSEVTRG